MFVENIYRYKRIAYLACFIYDRYITLINRNIVFKRQNIVIEKKELKWHNIC